MYILIKLGRSLKSTTQTSNKNKIKNTLTPRNRIDHYIILASTETDEHTFEKQHLRVWNNILNTESNFTSVQDCYHLLKRTFTSQYSNVINMIKKNSDKNKFEKKNQHTYNISLIRTRLITSKLNNELKHLFNHDISISCVAIQNKSYLFSYLLLLPVSVAVNSDDIIHIVKSESYYWASGGWFCLFTDALTRKTRSTRKIIFAFSVFHWKS